MLSARAKGFDRISGKERSSGEGQEREGSGCRSPSAMEDSGSQQRERHPWNIRERSGVGVVGNEGRWEIEQVLRPVPMEA